MKHLRKFYEDYGSGWTTSSTQNAYTPSNNLEEDELPLIEFKETLKDLENRLYSDLKGVTEDILELVFANPIIKEDEEYSKEYWNFVRKWQIAKESQKNKNEE